MLPKLDPLLHSELRLAIMSILASVEEADFNYLKEQTGATSHLPHHTRGDRGFPQLRQSAEEIHCRREMTALAPAMD